MVTGSVLFLVTSHSEASNLQNGVLVVRLRIETYCGWGYEAKTGAVKEIREPKHCAVWNRYLHGRWVDGLAAHRQGGSGGGVFAGRGRHIRPHRLSHAPPLVTLAQPED